MYPPNKINIRSDQNILQYQSTVKVKDGVRYEYLYVKSKTKKGETLSLTKEDLDRLISTNY